MINFIINVIENPIMVLSFVFPKIGILFANAHHDTDNEIIYDEMVFIWICLNFLNLKIKIIVRELYNAIKEL